MAALGWGKIRQNTDSVVAQAQVVGAAKITSKWGKVKERTIVAQKRHPTEVLERILNKTTLTTKKMTHKNILDLNQGSRFLEIGDIVSLKMENKYEQQKQDAVHNALSDAWKEAERAKQHELSNLTRRLRREQEAALENQAQYYDDLAVKTSKERDIQEHRKIENLKKKLFDEKTIALQTQWEKAIIMRDKAVEEACIALEEKLRNEFVVERALAVKEALQKAREEFDKELALALERQRAESEADMERRLAEQRELHRMEVERLNQRYDRLMKTWKDEIAKRELVERDFRELQLEFQRFMDYSDGMFSADFMLSLKRHGLQLAHKSINACVSEIVQEIN